MKLRTRVLSYMLLLVLAVGGTVVQSLHLVGAPPRRQLHVVLYPFIPEFASAAENVKKSFEERNPDIELDVIDLSSNYYDPSYEPYVGNVKADVFELDSVFLADFVQGQKIQPLPADFLLPQGALLSNAYRGSMRDGVRYGAAHWVCRNFLFYDKSHAPASPIKTLADLETFIGPPDNGRLLLDFRGKLTVSEIYLMAAFDRFHDWSAISQKTKAVDPDLEKDLSRVLNLCPLGSCRDQVFHELTGIYGQQFGRKYSKAVVGYSELLHSVLTERELCGKDCLADLDIGVSELPLDDSGATPISWVDSYVLSSGCKGACIDDARKFIAMMNSDEMYMKLLLPTGFSFLHSPAAGKPVPAYLLPAKASLYENPQLRAAAHLYPELKPLIENSAVPTDIGLNADLQTIGRAVNADLGR